MHAVEGYDYAVVRVVPRVERGEFVNAGVIVSCEAAGYLQARMALAPAKVLALDPSADLELIARHLDALVRVCQGEGPIGRLPLRPRFHWLTAPRSALVQTSPVHMGRCTDLDGTLDHLLRALVC